MRQRLRKIREERGWSQATAAAHIGISRAGYASIEIGRRTPGLFTALKISQVFALRIEDFANPKEDIS